VDEDRARAVRDALAAALVEIVAAPVDVLDRLRGHASAALVQQRHAVGVAQDLDLLVLGQLLAVVDDGGLDLERVAAGDLGRARLGGDEVGVLELGAEAAADQGLADRGQAVGRRGDDADLLEGRHQRLAVLGLEVLGLAILADPRFLADLARGLQPDAAEVVLQERGDLAGLGVLGHVLQLAELDPQRVGLDLDGLGRQLLAGAREHGRRPVGFDERELGVRVDDAGGPQVLVDRLLAAHVAAGHRDLEPRAGVLVPVDDLLVDDLGLVLLGVEPEVDLVGGVVGSHACADGGGLAGGELAVHDDGADADALLAAALPDAVELRSVEQPAEHLGDLALDDAGAVVLDDEGVLVVVALVDLDADVGQHVALLAGVEGVVDALLDARDEGSGRVVEPEDVLVPLEELRDGDVSLLVCKFVRDAHALTTDG
jgi:hypothetical protein